MDKSVLGSRSLLYPGPQPPLSHLGATLLRHVIGSGMRYSMYQLGLPMPEGPPVRIARLRLYLDATAIRKTIGNEPGGTEIVAALLDPAGSASYRLPAGLAGSAAFHRLRLKAGGRRVRSPRKVEGDSPWPVFRRTLSAALPALEDAFLAELVAALERRSQRRRGQSVAPAMSREAAGWQRGRRVRLDHLGPPDPLALSWSEEAPEGQRLDSEPWSPHPLRGRFRERYRAVLDRLRPLYLRLAQQAVENGLLAEPSDAFFIPFDLTEDLAAERRPEWLAGAVATNRREYQANLEQAAPAEQLRAGDQVIVSAPTGDRTRPGWELAPLQALD